MSRPTLFFLILLSFTTPRLEAQRAARPEVADSEQADVLAAALDAISQMHMNGVADSTLWEAAIDGMIEALNDPYASIFTPVEAEAWEEETTGNYSGIGLQITQLNREVTVTAVFRSTPAMQVGIVVGDVIVGVNEHNASEWTTDMAADSIRGPTGTQVVVKIKREGFEEPIPFELTRAQVHVPAVNWGVLESGIGFVVLDRVARNAAREMDEALRSLAGAQGLIIDLRRNPGGFLDESLMLADIFLEPGSTLASTVQRVPGAEMTETTSESFNDRWPARVEDLPIVVLVDRFTASGAEILAGALQDYDRAVVLGERTFGKGVVQTVMRLPHGRRLRFTTGSWQTPLGRSLQRARDAEMRPLEEDLDTFPRVRTAAGRSLVNAGGIFPDLEVADDTLTIPERELLRTVGEAQFPLGLREAEFGFEVANELRESGAPVALTDARFDAFIDGLVEAGLPVDAVLDPSVRTYLNWRVRLTIAQRMEDIGAEAEIRMERDPVLTEAVRLLTESRSQADLFAAILGVASPEGEVGRN
jgi:carboxyl-terminal processing protease